MATVEPILPAPLSGLIAADDGGRVATAGVIAASPFLPHLSRPSLPRSATARANSAAPSGRTLGALVRIQQFHSNLSDFPATLDVWHEALDGAPLPISAVEMPWLPVPGARILLELWVYGG